MTDDFRVDFFGIGVIRAATTWIYHCLREHPEICMSSVKETRFFDHYWWSYKNLDFYKNFFNHCDRCKIRGEFDPNYLYSAQALELIKNHFPNVKIIICLRNPIDRTYSNFLKDKLKEINSVSSFDQIIDQPDNVYVEKSLYTDKVKLTIDLFGRDRTLIVLYDDILTSRERFIKNIYNFLSVNPDFIPNSLDDKFNYIGNKKVRIPFINRFIHKIDYFYKRNMGLKHLPASIRRIKKANLKTQIPIGQFKKPELSNNQRKKLKEIFASDIASLGKLINRDLEFWLK